MARSSVPAWPGYREREPPRRLLALVTEREISTEQGEVVSYAGAAELRRFMFERGALGIIAGSVLGLRPAREALALPGASVVLDGRGAATALRLASGRQVRYLVPAATWGYAINPESPGSVRAVPAALRALLDYCGAGDYATPSALGQALMRRHWPEGAPLLSRPARWTWEQMHGTIRGGRVDTLRQGERFGELWESDINSAYSWAIASVPGGTAVACSGRAPSWATTTYQSARLTPCSHSCPCPLAGWAFGLPSAALRSSGSGGECWLWSEEAAAARSVGHQVTLGPGEAWPSLSTAFQPWVSEMMRLRAGAPIALLPGLKLVQVAAIGRFGADRVSRRLVDGDATSVGEPYCDPLAGLDNSYATEAEESDRAGLLVHVASYVHMRVRLRCWERAMNEWRAGALVATNYDAVYSLRAPADPSTAVLGGWKHRLLHDAIVRAPRWLESRERVATPGVSRRVSESEGV